MKSVFAAVLSLAFTFTAFAGEPVEFKGVHGTRALINGEIGENFRPVRIHTFENGDQEYIMNEAGKSSVPNLLKYRLFLVHERADGDMAEMNPSKSMIILGDATSGYTMVITDLKTASSVELQFKK